MYAAIDLLADKLDRLLMKHKEKTGRPPPRRKRRTQRQLRLTRPQPTPDRIAACAAHRPADRRSRRDARRAGRSRCACSMPRRGCWPTHRPRDTALLARGLREREQLGSTAIGHGIAIPHGRTNAWQDARAAPSCGWRTGRIRRRRRRTGGPGVRDERARTFHRSSTCRLLSELAERFADAGFPRCAARAPRRHRAARGCCYDPAPYAGEAAAA